MRKRGRGDCRTGVISKNRQRRKIIGNSGNHVVYLAHILLVPFEQGIYYGFAARNRLWMRRSNKIDWCIVRDVQKMETSGILVEFTTATTNDRIEDEAKVFVCSLWQ